MINERLLQMCDAQQKNIEDIHEYSESFRESFFNKVKNIYSYVEEHIIEKKTIKLFELKSNIFNDPYAKCDITFNSRIHYIVSVLVDFIEIHRIINEIMDERKMNIHDIYAICSVQQIIINNFDLRDLILLSRFKIIDFDDDKNAEERIVKIEKGLSTFLTTTYV